MADFSHFGAVILAAGMSRRMGGPNKLLQPYWHQPLVVHAFRTVAALGLRDCVAVTGRDDVDVSAIARSCGIRPVHNAAYAQGMGSSIAAGVSATAPNVAGIFIGLGDMPHVAVSDYEMLSAIFATRRIVIPIYHGARGHPVLFCESYRQELLELSGDDGARSIVRAHADQVVEAVTTNPGVCKDFDQPEDFQNS